MLAWVQDQQKMDLAFWKIETVYAVDERVSFLTFRILDLQ